MPDRIESHKIRLLLQPMPAHNTRADLHAIHSRPVVQRLRQMRRLDLFAPSQVGDRACRLEDAVVAARR
jgi:hypothetical protein